jgi:hypothetical protein
MKETPLQLQNVLVLIGVSISLYFTGEKLQSKVNQLCTPIDGSREAASLVP